MTQQEKKARQMVEELLCIEFAQDTGERVFEAREGYRTIYTGIYTDVHSVTVDGLAVDYQKVFFDKKNGKFFNSIVLKTPVCGEVTVDADWGFDCLPADLQALVNNAVILVSKSASITDVKRKRTEDFDITYGDLSENEVFVNQNSVTIGKYSMCNIGYIVNGATCGHSVRCFC